MGRIRVSPDGHEVAALVKALPGGRFVLGLTGAPGTGKSTLAAALAATYGVPVVHHGGDMVGFHSDMMWLPGHGVGAVVLTWWLGAYAIVFGVMLLVLAFQLHSKKEEREAKKPAPRSPRSSTRAPAKKTARAAKKA